ncbi:GNAT family N-acetyltransferase [Marinobacter sp.]|uniref:GNAT family N-acetyltransferase n=1 Tax=Marinobacter sp. TaxID=50741 RepID=UPI003A9263FF
MIRALTQDDIPTLLALFEQVGHEAGWIPRLEFNAEHIANHLATFIHRDNVLAVGAQAGPGEPLCGLLIAEVGSPWYSPTRIASERVFYVHPVYRRHGFASALITCYREWADAQGVAEKTIGNGLGLQPDGVRALCESQGFTPIGYIFKQL